VPIIDGWHWFVFWINVSIPNCSCIMKTQASILINEDGVVTLKDGYDILINIRKDSVHVEGCGLPYVSRL